jgi:hypothetical protein
MTGEPWVPLPPEAVETENVGSRPADYCVACGYPRPGRGGHNNRPAALEALEALTAALPPGDTVDTRLYYTTSDDGVWLDRPDGTSTNLGHGASVADALREL